MPPVTTLEDIVAAIAELQRGQVTVQQGQALLQSNQAALQSTQAILQAAQTSTAKQVSDVIILIRGNPDLGAVGLVPRFSGIEKYMEEHGKYHDKIENRAQGAIWLARIAAFLGGGAALAVISKVGELIK